MKKFAIFVFALIGLIAILAVAAAFILPMFISVADYKQEIRTKFEQSTGYAIDFDDIELSVFPSVHASASNVNISNGSKTIAQAAEVNAYADLMKLIKGEFEIASVDVNTPEIFYEKYANGNSWAKKDVADEAKSASAGEGAASSNNLSIEKINIIDGKLNYDDAVSRDSYKITNINLESAFYGTDQPIAANGWFTLGENEFAVDAKIDDLDKKSIALNLRGATSEISFSGTNEKGEFSITSENINKLAELVGEKDAVSLPKPNLSAKGNFTISENSTYLDVKEVSIGSSKGTAKIALQADGKIVADVKMGKLVLDDFIAPEDDIQSASASTKSSSGSAAVPEGLNMRLSLRADELQYKKFKLRKLDLQTAVNKGEVVLQPLSFDFENGGDFEAFGVYNQPTNERQVFEGKIKASGKDLYNILRSNDIDVANINPEQLKKFSLDTSLFASISASKKFDLSNLQLSVGDKRFAGSMQYIDGAIPQITLQGSVNSINLDELFIEKTAPSTRNEKTTSAKNRAKLNFDWLKTLPANMNLALVFNSLVFDKEKYENLRLTAIAKANELDVQSLSVAAMGTQITGKLKLTTRESRPKIDTSLQIGFLNFEPTEKSQVKPASTVTNGTSSRWSNKPISFSPLDEFDAGFKIQIQGIRQGDLRVDNINLQGNLDNSQLNISELTARGFGGELNLAGAIGVGVIPSFNLNFIGQNLDLQAFSAQLGNNDRLSGIVNVKTNLTSTGGTEAILIENLKGGVAIGGTNIIVYGFDLEGFVNKITNINNPLEVGLIAAKVLDGGGQTLITSLQGSFGIDKGLANTQGLVMQTRVGQGVFKGNIDLPKWMMDTNAYFTIDLGDQKERPKIGIRMYGQIDNFKKDFDYSEVISYYSKRFGVSDKIGNILDGFLKQ